MYLITLDMLKVQYQLNTSETADSLYRLSCESGSARLAVQKLCLERALYINFSSSRQGAFQHAINGTLSSGTFPKSLANNREATPSLPAVV